MAAKPFPPGPVIAPAFAKNPSGKPGPAPGSGASKKQGVSTAFAPPAFKSGPFANRPPPQQSVSSGIPASPVIPAQVNPPPVMTEGEARILMDHVNAEITTRSNIDQELQQLVQESEECLTVPVPQGMDSFQQTCRAQLQQIGSERDRLLSLAEQTSSQVTIAKQEIASVPAKPVQPAAPLNTDDLSQALSDILAQTQATFDQIVAEQIASFNTDKETMMDYANQRWAAFGEKYNAVQARLEEVKNQYAPTS